MKDVSDPRFMYFKAVLFLLGGLFASGYILLKHPDLRLAGLLAAAIWCFCRGYHFLIKVIELHIDGGRRFSGLWSYMRYVMRERD